MWAGYRTRFPTGAIIHVVSGPLIQLPISDGAANETENSGWLKKNCSLRENHTYSHLKYWCLNVWVCVFVLQGKKTNKKKQMVHCCVSVWMENRGVGAAAAGWLGGDAVIMISRPDVRGF